jgi:hypothetical protein
MISDIDLETLEKEYLDYIVKSLNQDIPRILEGLNSRIKILNDWRDQFLRTCRKDQRTGRPIQASDLKDGAQRIFHNFFAPFFKFPNSCPIGSDMMYEVPEAIIHIEVKTCLASNPSDYRGKVPLERNQISYMHPRFSPNLPPIYQSINKPTLTYAIQIVHEHMKPEIEALNVICIPNGQLYKYYPNMLQAGKGGWAKATNVRYRYIAEPRFVLLSRKLGQDIYRIEILLLRKGFTIKKLTGKNLPLKPYNII